MDLFISMQHSSKDIIRMFVKSYRISYLQLPRRKITHFEFAGRACGTIWRFRCCIGGYPRVSRSCSMSEQMLTLPFKLDIIVLI